MADMYYYNGVLLPEIPADMLAEYPYCYIYELSDGVTFRLMMATSKSYFDTPSGNMYVPPRAQYEATAESEEFTFIRTSASGGEWGLQNGIVWSNYDIPNGSADATEIYFEGSEPVDPNTPDDDAQTEVYYRISGERLKGFADQVRRISGVEGELTPEQMETNLLNVTPLGEYPKAEEGAFGVDSGGLEFGITNMGKKYDFAPSGCSAGWSFEPSEAISVHGLRYYDYFGTGNIRVLTLWNPNGDAVRQVEYTSVNDSAWHSVMFDTPMNIGVGETYTVSVFNRSSLNVGSPKAKNTEFNTKLNNVKGLYSSTESNVMPTETYSGYTPLVDIIIGSVAAELPFDYQIQRTTMDDIAEEVQRLTGATEKLTTAQIITGLREVEVLEDYEEVAF